MASMSSLAKSKDLTLVFTRISRATAYPSAVIFLEIEA